MNSIEKKKIIDSKELDRIITRLCYQIVEANEGLENVVLVGIHRRGVPLAIRVREKIKGISHQNLYQGSLDISFHRDDYRQRLELPEVRSTNIGFSLNMKTVILIDDVLYTGRTIRAAMNEIFTYGRPSSIQLGVLIDRGHRELPIKADYVGKNYPTSINEHIHVHLEDVDKSDEILLVEYEDI